MTVYLIFTIQDYEYLFSIIDPFEMYHNPGDRVKKLNKYDVL